MSSEFSSLLELALSKGLSHSDLISDINRQVLASFLDSNPKSPADASVFVNTDSGDVRIFSGDADITPKGFAPKAASLARQVIITRLGEAGPAPEVKSPKVKIEFDRPKAAAVSSLLGNLFFFGYNIYFFFFNLLLVISFFSGQFWTRPWAYLTDLGLLRFLFSVTLFLTPAATMFLALRRRLFRRPGALLRLFFLFELPLVAACSFPLVLVTQTTPFVILVSLLALALPGIFYLYSADIKFSLFWHKAVYFVQQFVFIVSAYLSLLFAFFVPPILAGVAGLFFGSLGDIFYRPTYDYYGGIMPYPPSPEPIFGLFIQLGLGLLVLLLIASALLVPYLILMVVWRALAKTRTALAQVISSDQLFTLDAIFIVVILTVSSFAAYQPSGNRLLIPLKDLTTKTTFADKEAIAKSLLPEKDRLSRLITDKLQSRSRYLFTKDDTTLKSAYDYSLHLPAALAGAIQQTFLTLAYPLVYQGDSRDSYALQTNYQYLFGEGLRPGKPVPTPVPAKNVLLTYRKVTVTPTASGQVAAVTIEEEYANQLFSQQEVVYEFILPRGAVMTDLRLGPDLEFTGQIAPKGAAQRTYERQLQIRRDPALLEETGPRQYRLRVFPVPAKNDFATLKGRRQKVSFTYAVAAAPQGYPLPQITRQTNVYTTAASQLYYVSPLGNRPLKDSDRYLPFPDNLAVDVCGGTGTSPAGFRLFAASADSKSVACGSDQEVLTRLNSAKIAVFLNVSAGNTSPQFTAFLAALAANKDFVSRNQIDLFKFNDLLSAPVTLTSDNLSMGQLVAFFGTGNSWVPLARFNQRYDLVFIFGSKRDAFTASDTLPFSAPTRVFYVHPAPPPLPMKLASQLLQTGGDVVDSFTDGLRLHLLSIPAGSYPLSRYLGLSGLASQSDQVPTPGTESTPGVQLANHAAFRLALSGFTKDISGDVSVLDKLHAFSVAAHLVSPYSSLLALVNLQQQQTLDQMSQDYNRYQDQPLTESVQPRPVPMPMDNFQSLRSSGPGIFDSMFGTDLIQVNLGEMGDVANVDTGGRLMAPAIGSTMYGAGSGGVLPGFGFGGLSLFIIANVVLLVLGLGFYLFRLLRPRK